MLRKTLRIFVALLMIVQLTACGNNTHVDDEFDAFETTGNDNPLNKMSYVLPEGLVLGDFDEYLGMGGGIPLLNYEGTVCGCIEINNYASGISESGQLVGVTQFSNHAMFVSEFIPIPSGAPCVTVKYAKDIYDEKIQQYVGEQYMWYAFWAKEGYAPMYALYLDAAFYNYEDLAVIAESVTFSDDAFVEAQIE